MANNFLQVEAAILLAADSVSLALPFHGALFSSVLVHYFST